MSGKSNLFSRQLNKKNHMSVVLLTIDVATKQRFYKHLDFDLGPVSIRVYRCRSTEQYVWVCWKDEHIANESWDEHRAMYMLTITTSDAWGGGESVASRWDPGASWSLEYPCKIINMPVYRNPLCPGTSIPSISPRNLHIVPFTKKKRSYF